MKTATFSLSDQRLCPRCKQSFLLSLFPKTSGGRVCYCLTCKNAVENAAVSEGGSE
jgi:hypothetical protein